MIKRKRHRLAKFSFRRSAGTTRSDYSADARTWLQWAEATYAAADVLFEDGNPFVWFGAAVLGHQALEMFLKAILIGSGRRIARNDVWGHDLLMLAHEASKSGTKLPIEVTEYLRIFNGFFNELRYPTALKEVSGLGGFKDGLRLTTIVLILRPFAEHAAGLGGVPTNPVKS